MRFKMLVGAVAAAAVFAPAYAAPTLQFSTDNGVTYTSCADGDACDANAVAGVVTYVNAIGGWIVNVTTGLGNIGSGTNLIDLNSVNVSGGAGSLIIGFSDTGYTGTGPITFAWGGTVSGAGSSASASAWYSTTNTLFSTTSLIASAGPFMAAGGAFASNLVGPGSASSPYSLTQRIFLTAGEGGTTYSGDFELKRVPEPATMALVALGLLGIGGLSRRRKAP